MKQREAQAIIDYVETVSRMDITGHTYDGAASRFMGVVLDPPMPPPASPVPAPPPPPIQPTGWAQELAILRELHRRCEAQRVAFYFQGGTEPSSMMQSIYTQLDIFNANFRKPRK